MLIVKSKLKFLGFIYRAIINNSNREGWLLYNTLSNKYAPEIKETIPKYKNKNQHQQAFKQIMHDLDIECFGIK